MKKLILSAIVLALAGGAASADHWRGGGHAQGGVVVHDNSRGWHGNGGRVEGNRGWNNGDRVVVHGDGGYRGDRHDHDGWRGDRGGWRGEPRYYHNRGYARANIWMPRPVIRSHYYHYGYRPSLIEENYGYRDGYVFVRGDWSWDGYEWVWQPGHYEPDAAYVEVY